ncbi:MAG: glycosyltransferase family 2 protein [Deltaproteobacteria bacterium]|nr:glycosyltransferase family 2 protein [Deltaproteobacteria bacterium]
MISAFVITHNSEKFLKRCLSSLSFVDEIIIVDSNSTDKTLEIAREMGAKIIQKEFTTFSEKKEFAKNQCKNQWILNIDADEYLPYETAKEIQAIIKENKHDAYLIPFKTYFETKEIRYGRHKNELHIRLFKKFHKYGRESVHEKIINAKNIGRLNNFIIHTPYECLGDIKLRASRNAKLASQDKTKINIFLIIVFVIFNPIIRFIKEYIILLGFLDGYIGLYLAFYSAKEVYLKYLWGLKKKIKP